MVRVLSRVFGYFILGNRDRMLNRYFVGCVDGRFLRFLEVMATVGVGERLSRWIYF